MYPTPPRAPRNELEAAGLLHSTHATQLQRTAAHRQRHTTPINADRMQMAVADAFKTGQSRGYRAGYEAGARWVRLSAFCWGVAVGGSLVAGSLKLGLLLGPAT